MMEWIGPRSYVPGWVSTGAISISVYPLINCFLTSIVVSLQCILGLLGIFEVPHHFGDDLADQDVEYCPLPECLILPLLIIMKSDQDMTLPNDIYCYAMQRAPVGKSTRVQFR